MSFEIQRVSSVLTASNYVRDDASTNTANDWSFAFLKPRETLWGPHGYHRYPAKFIPQLVRRIIDTYSCPGDLVGDTFVGSATTGIEALRSGRRFWGSDVNPVALLIGRAKCIPLLPAALDKTWKQLTDQLKHVQRIGRRPLTEKEKGAILAIDISRATDEERFAYWFPSEYQQVLESILQEILAIAEEPIRIFFLCGFSNILRRSSIWLSGSTKPQKDLKKYLSDPTEEFHKQMQDMIRRNALYWTDLGTAHIDPHHIAERCHLTQADARALPLASEALDLLVTSPPYATCYAYNELHQLTHLWFTRYHIFPSPQTEIAYIGSKAVSKRNQQANYTNATLSQQANSALAQLASLANASNASAIQREVRQLHYYFQDMYAALRESARVVASGKRLVLIIGDSRRRGITIPTSAALCELAESVGFALEQRIVREVPGRILVSTRDMTTGRFSSRPQSDGQAYSEEDILVFSKRPVMDQSD
jgi:DNA modification methylase